MESIRDKVAIVGMGCTRFGELWNKGVDDLVIDACYEAFGDAHIGLEDVQAAWLATNNSGHRGVALLAPLKMRGIPVTRIENACTAGTDAFRNACYGVASGAFDVVLVCGVEKLKDYGFSGLPASPPSYPEMALSQTRPATPMPLQFALMANRYFHQHGIDYHEGKTALAKIAAKNHHNGTLSPKAHFRSEVSIDAIVNAPMIATPLGLFDCCAVSDGCAAAIIVPADLASRYRDDYVLVKGLGLAGGDEYAQIPSDFDWTHWEENLAASAMAYRDAGVTNPREQIDMAIVHDCFTINELVTYEDLGFSERGRALEDIDSGFFQLDGGLPVNTDGGLLCFGHPIAASGLRMIYEAYKQLQCKAGERQVEGVRLALTHNIGGWPGAMTSGVSVLGRQD